MNNNEDILKKLESDTKEGKINWDVSAEGYTTVAEYSITPTNKKGITFRIIAFNTFPEFNKLIILRKKIVNQGSVSEILKDIGGKINEYDRRKVTHLMNLILKKEDNDVTDIEFKLGDRVVVVKTQDFDGDEIGQEGKIVQIIDEESSIFYVIKFDKHFSNLLVDDTGFYDNGNSWVFRGQNIKKL